MLQSIVFVTLGQLATGILLFIAFIPSSKIGVGFGRFHTMLAAGLWLLAIHASWNPEFFLLTFLLAGAYFFSGKDRYYYPFLIAAIAVSLHLLIASDRQIYMQRALLALLLPVLVLGASSVAMLLGHWYLVSPKLSIGYLKWITIGLIAALLIRSGFILEAVLTNSARLQQIRFFEIYGMFFIQRIVLGLLLTLILSVLTYFCVRIRSTQSATGILYVVLVFCLIGELIGSYLFLKTGILF